MVQSGTTTCSIEGCASAVRARGWCNAHYLRWRNHGSPHRGQRKSVTGQICTVKDCLRPVKTREWCSTHYRQWARTGATGNRAPRAVDPTCTGCGRQRTINPAGRYVCRPCKVDYLRRYYAENTERLCADARTAAAAKRASDPAGVRARNLKYYRANPSVFLAGNQRRRARRRDAVCEHGDRCVTPAFLAEVHHGTCRYCGATAEHADHFMPLARGGLHCRDNIVPACAPCNLSKQAALPEEWAKRIGAATSLLQAGGT